MDNAQSSDKTPETPSKSERKNKVFPRVEIAPAVQLVEAIWSIGQELPVRTTEAFEQLKRSHSSGPGRMLITTAGGGYGLIHGSYQAARLSLTENGKGIASSTTEQARIKIVHDILMKGEAFAKVHTRFLDQYLPSDSVGTDFIQAALSLSDADAQLCWRITVANLRYARLLKNSGDRETVIASDEALSLVSNDRNSIETQPPATETFDDPPSDEQRLPDQLGSFNPRKINRRTPDVHINIQIHLPDDSTAEVYDSIFASIRKNLYEDDVDESQ